MKVKPAYIALALLVLLTGCAYIRPIVNEDKYKDYEVIAADALINIGLADLGSFPEFDEKAPIIVKGYVLDDGKAISSEAAQDYRGTNRTISTLVVTKAYKGELAKGDRVPLIEDYRIRDRKIFIHLGYAPSIPGKDYIFFLFKPEREPLVNMYWVAADSMGRYTTRGNVDDIYTVEGPRPYRNREDYVAFAQEVRKKYR